MDYGHTARAAACPVKRLCAGNADAYDRGGDPTATDPFAHRATATHTVTVPVALVLAGLVGKGEEEVDPQAPPPKGSQGGGHPQDQGTAAASAREGLEKPF